MLTKFPLETDGVVFAPRPASSRRMRVEALINEPVAPHGHTGTDSAWSMKLKICMDAVARRYQVAVLSAKPVQAFEAEDPRDMRFEVHTAHGALDVIRSRAGEHEYVWK